MSHCQSALPSNPRLEGALEGALEGRTPPEFQGLHQTPYVVAAVIFILEGG